MANWASELLKKLESNPEAKASLERSLQRELPALPPGKGMIELPGKISGSGIEETGNAIGQPYRDQLRLNPGNNAIPLGDPNPGVIETGAMGQGTPTPPAEDLKMLNAGKGDMTPIELPAAQLSENGNFGHGTPGDSPEALASLPPEMPTPPAEIRSSESNPYLDQAGADSPFEGQSSHEPMMSEAPSPENPAGMSLAKKTAIGATGLGILGGTYELLNGNSSELPPSPLAPARNPAQAPAVDPHSLMAKISGRDDGTLPLAHRGIPSAHGSGITPNITDQHLQDALQFGDGHEQAAALQEVRNRQSMAELASGLGKAGSIIGAGIARTPVSKDAMSAFDEQEKQAGTITSDYIANQEHDPKSQQSMALRGVLDKLGIKYNGEPTAAQLKSALPYIFKDQEAKQAQASQADLKKYQWALLAQRQKEMKQQKDLYQDYKQRKDDETETGKMGKELNSLSASSRSVLGQAAKAKLQADRMIQVLNMNDDPNSQQYEASVIDLNGALGGPNTEGTLKGLQYDNLKTRWSKLVQKYGSGISAVHTPEVKKQMLDIAREMKMISNHIIDKNAHVVKAAHPDLISRHPEKFDDLIREMNWEPEVAPAAAAGTPPAPGGSAPPPPSSGGPAAPSWAIKQ